MAWFSSFLGLVYNITLSVNKLKPNYSIRLSNIFQNMELLTSSNRIVRLYKTTFIVTILCTGPNETRWPSGNEVRYFVNEFHNNKQT